MLKIIKTAALSTLIGLGALSTMPAAAQAQNGGIYFGFGNSGPNVGLHFEDRGRHDYRDRRGYRDNRRHAYRDRGCSPREAVRKAYQMGLRDVQVIGSGPRTVRVKGRGHGYRAAIITFADRHNCPVIR
jgi:hypothetical protein